MIPNFATKPHFLSSGKVFTQQMILTFWHITTSLFFFATKSDSVPSLKFFIKKNFFILSPLQGQIQELQCDFLCNRVDIEFSSPPIITMRYDKEMMKLEIQPAQGAPLWPLQIPSHQNNLTGSIEDKTLTNLQLVIYAGSNFKQVWLRGQFVDLFPSQPPSLIHRHLWIEGEI